jgi:MraZ protein
VALFTGVHINKLDKKGRVSVPATFRAALAGLSFPGVYAYPARVARAVECCGIDWMERLNERIGMLSPHDGEGRAFAASIFAQTHQLPFDPEGRISLPEQLAQHAAIDGQVAFVGIGQTFQVWQPQAFDAYMESALRQAPKQAGQFGLSTPGGGA